MTATAKRTGPCEACRGVGCPMCQRKGTCPGCGEAWSTSPSLVRWTHPDSADWLPWSCNYCGRAVRPADLAVLNLAGARSGGR